MNNTLSITIKNKGFTLMELVMILLILGIVAVAAVAKFSNTSTYTMRTFYDDIRNSIRYAQSYAVGTGCRIQVNLTATTLTLTQASGCTSGNFSPGVAVRNPNDLGAASFTVTAPTGSNLTITNISADFPIYFDGLGMAHRSDTTVGTDANPYTLTAGGRNISIIGETGFTQ